MTCRWREKAIMTAMGREYKGVTLAHTFRNSLKKGFQRESLKERDVVVRKPPVGAGIRGHDRFVGGVTGSVSQSI